ncbi:hypothetical protein M758_2G163200 [Ceratodon purpureus]|nr:hypothetical protein M758_2G163200 [Ceratodon purpureus]
MFSVKEMFGTMSMCLCSSQFTALPACVDPGDVSSRMGISRASWANLLSSVGSFGMGEATRSSGRRIMVVHAGKGKRRPIVVDRWTRASTTTSPDAAPVASPDAASDVAGAPKWDEFAAQVSGEWDGYSVEFNMFGEPLELPENVVPEAFREWERKVHDWQTQCPTLAHPEKGHLWYKVIRLLPTVGCEADAATVYSVEECDLSRNASALAYHSSGSYTSVWRGNRVTNEKQGSGPGKVVIREGDEVEVEQCLVHEKTRIRVFQKLGSRRRILIFREAWEGPFRNGESLGGCAAATAAFATETKLKAKAILGKWNSEIYTLQGFQPQEGYTSSELTRSGTEVLQRTPTNTFLYGWLPKDMWTLLLKTESGGTTIETGWLAEPDMMIVTKCEIGSSGDLKEVSLRVEKRISNEVPPLKVSAQDVEDLLTE